MSVGKGGRKSGSEVGMRGDRRVLGRVGVGGDEREERERRNGEGVGAARERGDRKRRWGG